MSRDADWAAPYGDDPEDDSDGPSHPPIWVVVLVAAAVATGVWLLFTQGFAESDPVTSPTLLPLIPVANQPATVTAESPQQLRGLVAVTSANDPRVNQDTVWVFQPDGSVVSRADAEIERSNDPYPMLITAGRLILGNQVFDVDLAEPPISPWSDEAVIPGSGPGAVWLAKRPDGITSNSYSRVSPVDVESLTLDRPDFDIADLFSRPVAGVADGLIVVDLEGDFAFWSSTDGLVPLDLPEEPERYQTPVVVTASGDLVVVNARHVNVLDFVSGEYVSSFEMPDNRNLVRSACLSPDGQHVIVVPWNGQAYVGNITTGEVIVLNEAPGFFGPTSIQPKHGIGWTADDQLVFIADNSDLKHIIGLDVATGESFDVATLEGPGEWWMTASGTMC